MELLLYKTRHIWEQRWQHKGSLWWSLWHSTCLLHTPPGPHPTAVSPHSISDLHNNTISCYSTTINYYWHPNLINIISETKMCLNSQIYLIIINLTALYKNIFKVIWGFKLNSNDRTAMLEINLLKQTAMSKNTQSKIILWSNKKKNLRNKIIGL